MLRPCLTCGTPTQDTRCLGCSRVYDQRRRPTSTERGYDRGYQKQRALLIGQECALRLPGCTGVADTADHVLPVRDWHGVGPLRPACKHCNSARGAGGRVRGGLHSMRVNPVLAIRERYF